MRQYHVKLHFHVSKKCFAYDMWQWLDQVEENQSLSQVGLFWSKGNLVYESEDTLSRGHVLVKEGLAHQNP